MADNYQAVYDAVRSRLGNCDVGGAIEGALREANFSHYADMASRAMQDAACSMAQPHVLMRPALSIDGNMWCALYGENLQDGLAGFGESPYLAMMDFDRAWATKLSAIAKATSPSASIGGS